MSIDTKERQFFFPLTIIQAAEREGISVSTLNDMVRHSTRITHPKGNRRYNGWLFTVEGNDVIGFGKIQDMAEPETVEEKKAHEPVSSVDEELAFRCSVCEDRKRVVVFNPCSRCNGEGCKYCDRGLVQGSIVCVACQ